MPLERPPTRKTQVTSPRGRVPPFFSIGKLLLITKRQTKKVLGLHFPATLRVQCKNKKQTFVGKFPFNPSNASRSSVLLYFLLKNEKERLLAAFRSTFFKSFFTLLMLTFDIDAKKILLYVNKGNFIFAGDSSADWTLHLAIFCEFRET